MQLYLEIVLRTATAFLLTLAGSRFVGQPFKVVSGIAFGALAAWTVLYQATPVYAGILAMAIWALLYTLVSMAALKSMPLRNFVNGKATPLIQSGKVLEQNLRKSRLTVDDMAALLRTKNAFKVADVEFASLEGDGSLSVLLKSETQPLTPKAMQLSVQNESSPAVVIIDGQVQADALANLGFDRAWLLQQIQTQGATGWSDVFLAQVDSQGKVYVDLYDDMKKMPSSVNNQKPMVYASLKKIQADLEMFCMQTNHPEAKADYHRHAELLKHIIQTLAPYMQ